MSVKTFASRCFDIDGISRLDSICRSCGQFDDSVGFPHLHTSPGVHTSFLRDLILDDPENIQCRSDEQHVDEMSWWTTGNPASPILLTDTGESFPNYTGTLEILPLAESDERGLDRDFRLLRLRSIVIQIGAESFVAGTLSFHTETEGWFIWGDADNRVPFTWSATGE